MILIILTKDQAEKVRGRHGKYSALDPILTDNGMYILPIEVLDDPEHKEVFEKLGECKFAEVDISDEVDKKLPQDDPMKIKQVLTVKSISPVSVKEERVMTERKESVDYVTIDNTGKVASEQSSSQ